MSSSEIRAGSAFVEVFLKSKVKKGATEVHQQLEAMSAGVSAFGADLAKIGATATAAMGAVAAALGASVLSFADAGSKLNDMSARTGVSAEALGALAYAAKQSGTSIEEVEGSLKKMQRAIADASNGSKSAIENFAAIGLSIDQLAGKSPEQQFALVSKAIASIEDPTKRVGAAMDVFGKSATSILPLITSDVQGLMDRARKLGIVLSEEDVAAADALGDTLDTLRDTIGALIVKVGAALAGPVGQMADMFIGIVSSTIKFVESNRMLVAAFAGFVTAGTAVGAVVTVIGLAIAGVGMAIGGIIAAVPALVAGFTAIAPILPIVLAIAAGAAVSIATWTAVGAAITYVAYESGLLREAFDSLMGIGKTLGATLGQTFDGVSAALSSGNLSGAVEILWQGIKVAFLQGSKYVLDVMGYLAQNVFTIIQRMASSAATTLWNLFKSIPQLIASGLSGAGFEQILSQAFSGGLSAALDQSINDAKAKLDTLTTQAEAAKAKADEASGAKGADPTKSKDSAAAAEAATARDQYMQSLRDEINVLELGADAAERLKLAQKGLSDEQLAEVEQLQARRKALQDAKKAEEDLKKAQEDATKRAQAMKEEVATPLERFQDKLKEIAELEASGDLDPQTASRQRAKAAGELLGPIEQRQQAAREAILNGRNNLVQANSQEAFQLVRQQQRQAEVSRLGLDKKPANRLEDLGAEQVSLLRQLVAQGSKNGQPLEVKQRRI